MVEFREETPKIQSVSPRSPPPNRRPPSRGRRCSTPAATACLPVGYKPPCLFSHCSPSLPESPQRPGVVSTGFSITSQGRSNRGITKRTARTSHFVPSRCLHGAKSVAKLHSVQVNADRRDDDTWLTWLFPRVRLTGSSGAGKHR